MRRYSAGIARGFRAAPFFAAQRVIRSYDKNDDRRQRGEYARELFHDADGQ